MKKIIRLKIHFVFALLVLAQASCIKRTRAIPAEQRLLPAKTAARADLLQGLEERSNQVKTLQGTIFLDLSGGGASSGVLTEYRQTRGVIVVDRPDHIRVKVQAPIVLSTLADMVSDGRQYRVSIPVKNQFGTGDVNAPIGSKSTMANLRPQHFLQGLFVDIRQYLKKPQIKWFFQEATEGRHRYYVFNFIDVAGQEAQILEKIWIDRTDLQVSRKQIFGKDGKVETDVEYSNYQNEHDVPYPKIIVIQRPEEDYTLKITFQKTTLNEKLADGTFDLERPEGSELVQLGQ